MNHSRRTFLKVAGLSLLGMGIRPSLGAGERQESPKFTRNPEGLEAGRWAMVVNMGKFKKAEDYQKCIQACHRAHNVPDIGDPRKAVQWIRAETYVHAFPGQGHEYIPEGIQQEPFLVFCNHCDNPPCVRVCPTRATFKREDGIVMIDEHRCIGCRFCMVACPFGARSFNWQDPRPFIKEINPRFPTRTKGVVEKCNFCVERLAEGLQPACVAESNGALIFGDLKDQHSEVQKILRSHYSMRRKNELGTRPCVFYII